MTPKEEREKRYNERMAANEKRREELKQKIYDAKHKLPQPQTLAQILPTIQDESDIIMISIPCIYNIKSKQLTFIFDDMEYSGHEEKGQIDFVQAFCTRNTNEFVKASLDIAWKLDEVEYWNMQGSTKLTVDYNKDTGDIKGLCAIGYWCGKNPTLNISFLMGTLNSTRSLDYHFDKNNKFVLHKY